MDSEQRQGLARAVMESISELGEAPPDVAVEAKLAAWVQAIEVAARGEVALEPVPMILQCPMCGARHIDRGTFATKPHHTHACQSCGHCWRPAVVPTTGVQFLPGFKDEPQRVQTKEERRG